MPKRALHSYDEIAPVDPDRPAGMAILAVAAQGGSPRIVDHEVLPPQRRPPLVKLLREPETAEQTALIRRIWGDTILADPAKVSAIVHVQSVMAEEGGKMLRSALNIGRALIDLRETLSTAEFARGRRRAAEAFRGWSLGNISKIMLVAEFVDSSGVALALLPPSVSTLYEFSTMDAEQLEQAKTLQLVRPDVRRFDVIEFKKAMLPHRESTKISAELARNDERIRAAKAELAEAWKERARILAKRK